MSHIATIKTEIRDLKALARACAELGLTFKENQKTCLFWPQGGEAQQHPCDHAIELPSGRYKMELGLVKTETGFDFVGDELLQLSGNDKDGAFWCPKIFGMETNPLGKDYNRLMQRYAVVKTEMAAQSKGWLTTRHIVPDSDKIQVHVTGA